MENIKMTGFCFFLILCLFFTFVIMRSQATIPAFVALETSIEYPEKFLSRDAPEFQELLNLIAKHKGMPDNIRKRVRGITHAQHLVYLALDNGEYRWVAPWEEFKEWK